MLKKSSFQATVRKCEREKKGSNIFILELDLGNNSRFTAQPGQFIVLEPLNKSCMWSRPFAIVDYKNNIISLLIDVVGSNTKAYSELKTGDKIGLNGPNGSPILINGNTERYILVCGGNGSAGLLFFAKKLATLKKDYLVFIGAKTEKELSGINFFAEHTSNIKTITDSQGFVTDLLLPELTNDDGKSIVLACGPPIMLKKTAKLCGQYGNSCLVVVEKKMACGMGSCKGCAIKMRNGTYKRVCYDGPAFLACRIDWGSFVQPSVTEVNDNNPALAKNPMEVILKGQNGKVLKLDYPTMNASGCLDERSLNEGRLWCPPCQDSNIGCI